MISTYDMASGPAKRGVLRAATLLMASSFTLFALAAVAPSLPAIERSFADVPGAALLTRLVLTLPALTVAATAQLTGGLIDRFGRRPLLIGSIILYVASGSAGIWLDGLIPILVSRAVLGVAVGGLLTALTTLIGDFYRGTARYRMTGAQFSVMVLAVAVGTTVSGFLAEADWRLPFYLYFGALVALPLICLSVPEPRVATAAQVIEPGGPAALPVGRGLAIYLLAVISLLTTFMVPSQLPFLFVEIGAGGAREAGIGIAVFNLAAAVVALLFRRVWERFGAMVVLAGSYGLLAAGFMVAATAGAAPRLLFAMVVAGAGFAALVPTFNAWILAIAPARLRGRAVAGVTTSVFLGTGLSPVYSQPLAELVGLPGAFAISAGLQAALAVGFAVAAMTAYVGLRRHR